MANPRIFIRLSDSQRALWESAAESDHRDLNEWAKRILDAAAESRLTVTEIIDLLKAHGGTDGDRKDK